MAISIRDDTPRNFQIQEGLTLQSSADEVLLNKKLFIVDCRSAKDYNAAHLSMAFFLDPKSLQEDPKAFNSSVEVLMEARKMKMKKNGFTRDGICFIGQTMENLNLVISYFLKQKIDRISFVNGGFSAIVKYLHISEFPLSDFIRIF